MICRQCLQRARPASPSTILFRPSTSVFRRSVGSTNQQPGAERAAAPRGPSRGSHEGAPAATSTSAAQPFSTPQSPRQAEGKPAERPSRPKSSMVAKKPMRALGWLKNRDPPFAKPDHEYPDWLWDLLTVQKAKDGDGGAKAPDLYGVTKGERRRAAKLAAQQRAAELAAPKTVNIPLDHQTVDLPSGDGTVQGSLDAIKARDELQSVMRRSRRTMIKETNFLKGV